LVDSNLREHLGVYVLASASSAFITASQYLAVSAAAASYLPVDPGTSALITGYGRGAGIVLALLLNSILFQGILAVLLVTLSLSAVVKEGSRWAYAFSAVIVSGFVGYWLGAKFLVILEWISTLQNNGVDSSNEYTGLFWFGLAATICYLAMLLVLRKSYGKLLERRLVVKDSP
jgi:formate/nitrite transporter FocA (FNT family)